MARVIRIHSNPASNWNFSTGYYWQYVDQNIIDQMVAQGVKTLTDAQTEQEAWQSLITYSAGENVGIEINGNDFPPFYFNSPSYLNTLPQAINAVIRGLKIIGVPETNIYVMELTGGGRRFPTYYFTEIQALYPNVVFKDNGGDGFGGDASLYVNGIGQYICNTIAQMDHLILIPLMKAIAPLWGITGTIKFMQGVIQNPSGTHGSLNATTNNPNVLVYQNSHIIGKVRLILADGIFGNFSGGHFGESAFYAPWQDPPQYTTEVPQRWQTFGNGAPKVVFFATDPVALDQKLYDHIADERLIRGLNALPDPQIVAGDGVIGSRAGITYVEAELGEEPPTGKGTLEVYSQPTSGKQVTITQL